MTQKMHGLFEKIIENQEARRQTEEKVFHYSAYWHTWSRILAYARIGQEIREVIEVNLTPVPGINVNWKMDVAPIVVRVTSVDSFYDQDKFEKVLPYDVKKEMVRYLGPELTNRLCYENFMNQIDVGLLRAFDHERHGKALYTILRGEYAGR